MVDGVLVRAGFYFQWLDLVRLERESGISSRDPKHPEIATYPHWEFLTGYIVEWALSVDNVFVFAVVFGHFRVPLKYQYRVLFWGILGAIIMRLVFIMAGSALLHYAEWMMPIFGAFLIYTGIKLAFKEDEEVHPEDNWLMKVGRKLFNVTTEPSGDKFFRKIDGRFYVTPLFLVLLVIESTDVIFAVDSVPAILSITQDTFIVFTSNIFAIMGLRALYFLLAGVMDMFRYLNYGLSAILVVCRREDGGGILRENRCLGNLVQHEIRREREADLAVHLAVDRGVDFGCLDLGFCPASKEAGGRLRAGSCS